MCIFRLSPEAVILGQLDMLKRGDLARAAKFHVFASVPHGADMSERAMASILESDNFLPILGHEQVSLPCLDLCGLSEVCTPGFDHETCAASERI